MQSRQENGNQRSCIPIPARQVRRFFTNGFPTLHTISGKQVITMTENQQPRTAITSVAVSADSSTRGIPIDVLQSLHYISAPRSHSIHHDVARELGCHPSRSWTCTQSTTCALAESEDSRAYLATVKIDTGGQCVNPWVSTGI
jgi:hypothetical protein